MCFLSSPTRRVAFWGPRAPLEPLLFAVLIFPSGSGTDPDIDKPEFVPNTNEFKLFDWRTISRSFMGAYAYMGIDIDLGSALEKGRLDWTGDRIITSNRMVAAGLDWRSHGSGWTGLEIA